MRKLSACLVLLWAILKVFVEKHSYNDKEHGIVDLILKFHIHKFIPKNFKIIVGSITNRNSYKLNREIILGIVLKLQVALCLEFILHLLYIPQILQNLCCVYFTCVSW